MRKLVGLAALVVLLAGCTGPDPKDSQVGYPNGFETEIRSAVALKNSPKTEDATLLTSCDAAVTKVLETERDAMLAAAIDAYTKEQAEVGPDRTKITVENCEVVLEDFSVAAEDLAATRKMYEGKVTKFRFTLRRPKARIVPDPTRVESVVNCNERSWAPGDTTRFPQIFRAEVMNRINGAIFKVASDQGLDPVKPSSARTR